MNPDQQRTKRHPADRPLPPVRTLRGDIHAAPEPAGAWVAPVRSGTGRLPPVPPPPSAEMASDILPGLQPLAQPLAGEAPPLPIGTWTDIAPDEAGAELVLEDEIWVADPDQVLEELDHGGVIEPLEGLTVAGDVARTEPELDEPPVSAPDLSVARPAPEQDENEQEAGEGDPAELARRLERLADRLRMHGSHALEESRDATDPMEAALAVALTSLLAQRED